MILGIFRRNNIFINVLLPCQHKIIEYYPIREKNNKFAILVMKLPTTFNRSLSLPTLPKYTVGSVLGQCLHVPCVRVTFLLQNATIAMVVGDAIYLFIFVFILRF